MYEKAKSRKIFTFAAAPFSMAYAESDDSSAHDDEWERGFREEFSDFVLDPAKVSVRHRYKIFALADQQGKSEAAALCDP